MKLSLLGVGNAGVRIVDQLRAAEQTTGRPFTDGNVLAFNTTESTFTDVDHITDKQQVVIGDTHPAVRVHEEPAADDEDRREGVDGDPELGVSVAEDDLPEIRRALDRVDDTEVDAAMVVAGLGGGTGCGLGSVLLEELQSIYEIPVYVLGVLPSTEESDRRAWTAARAIRTFVPLADAVIPVDNESWRRRSEDDEGYTEINRRIATRFVSLFAAGEVETSESIETTFASMFAAGKVETSTLSELRMDPNDIIRTLEVGGVSTIGYAKIELDSEPESWLTRLRRLLFDVPEPEPQTDAASIKRLVQRAVDSELTLPCDIETADRILLILSGPPKELSRKGFETGRYLLEEETGTVEILAGDEPLPDAPRITATVLLANVTGVPRIEQLQQRAVAFQHEQMDHPSSEDVSASTDEDDVDDQPTEESDIEPVAEAVDDGSDEVETEGSDEADDHGFEFDAEETVDNESVIAEAEPAADRNGDTDDSAAETETDDDNETETDDDNETETDDDNETETDGDEPTISDPFAGESTAEDEQPPQ